MRNSRVYKSCERAGVARHFRRHVQQRPDRVAGAGDAAPFADVAAAGAAELVGALPELSCAIVWQVISTVTAKIIMTKIRVVTEVRSLDSKVLSG